MSFAARSAVPVLGALMILCSGVRAQDNSRITSVVQPEPDDYFVKEVWPKVGATLCVQCHKKGGEAEGAS